MLIIKLEHNIWISLHLFVKFQYVFIIYLWKVSINLPIFLHTTYMLLIYFLYIYTYMYTLIHWLCVYTHICVYIRMIRVWLITFPFQGTDAVLIALGIINAGVNYCSISLCGITCKYSCNIGILFVASTLLRNIIIKYTLNIIMWTFIFTCNLYNSNFDYQTRYHFYLYKRSGISCKETFLFLIWFSFHSAVYRIFIVWIE